MSEYTAELVGGHPVLDFANSSRDSTAANPPEYMAEYADAARFGLKADILKGAELTTLVRLAEEGGVAGTRRSYARTAAGTGASARMECGPDEATRELRRLRALRGVTQRTLEALLREREPQAADLCELNREYADAVRYAELTHVADSLTQRIAVECAGLATLRYRLSRMAVELFTSQRLDRLGECPACGWFFLDATKNRSRRWCSMAMCGGTAKSRRYYERVTGKGK